MIAAFRALSHLLPLSQQIGHFGPLILQALLPHFGLAAIVAAFRALSHRCSLTVLSLSMHAVVQEKNHAVVGPKSLNTLINMGPFGPSATIGAQIQKYINNHEGQQGRGTY